MEMRDTDDKLERDVSKEFVTTVGVLLVAGVALFSFMISSFKISESLKITLQLLTLEITALALIPTPLRSLLQLALRWMYAKLHALLELFAAALVIVVLFAGSLIFF